MRKDNQLKQGISILLTFVILIHLSGCYATKKITTSELPSSSKYNYIIHYEEMKFQLLDMLISNGILSGHIATFKHTQEKSVHIFIPSNSGLELKPGAEFSINLNEVSKIEIKEFNKVNTDLAIIFGVLGGVGAIVVIIFLLTFDPHIHLSM